MDDGAAAQVIALFEGRGQLDSIEQAGASAARACLDRAKERLTAASVLVESSSGSRRSPPPTTRSARRPTQSVLFFGYRVPATQGGHRIATDIAHAAMQSDTDAFAPAGAERFRRGRHESEYFDPARPVDKSADDALWAAGLAGRAVEAVDRALSAR